jgi:hypothetical protein
LRSRRCIGLSLGCSNSKHPAPKPQRTRTGVLSSVRKPWDAFVIVVRPRDSGFAFRLAGQSQVQNAIDDRTHARPVRGRAAWPRSPRRGGAHSQRHNSWFAWRTSASAASSIGMAASSKARVACFLHLRCYSLVTSISKSPGPVGCDEKVNDLPASADQLPVAIG